MNGSACKDILSLEQNQSIDLEGEYAMQQVGAVLDSLQSFCFNALCVDRRDHIKRKPIKIASLKLMVS